MRLHPCPIPRCNKPLRPAVIMCGTHWRQVPKELRVEVYKAWRHGRPTEIYEDVRRVAIESVSP